MISNFGEIYQSFDRRSELMEKDGIVTVHSSELMEYKGILHGFTTRIGGVSPAPFDSLNFSFGRSDTPENVRENFKLLASSRDLNYDELILVNHEHGNNVVRVDRRNCGCGISRDPLPYCDGLITDDPDVTLITLHADCGGVFIYDEERKAIGLAHAGWKGTLSRIGQKLVESMTAEFGSLPELLKISLSPCICFDCFEVDSSLAEAFSEQFEYAGIYKDGRPGKAYVDIAAALCVQLLEAGVSASNISIMQHCTFEERKLFYSYRRDGRGTGAMASYLKII